MFNVLLSALTSMCWLRTEADKRKSYNKYYRQSTLMADINRGQTFILLVFQVD
jgi:hypothetical protein